MKTESISVSEDTTTIACKNCGNTFTGKYCNACGEKVVSGHERSLAHFIHETFHTITHADGKIFRSLKLMLTRPGYMSKMISEGVRQPYMKPISLFFVGNLIYFLFPFYNTFNTPLSTHYKGQLYSSAIAEPIVARKLERQQITFEEYAKKYDAKTATLSKLLLILIVPMAALAFKVINFRRKPYFADHMLLSLEFMSFTLFYTLNLFSLLVIVVLYVAAYAGIDASAIAIDDTAVVVVLVLLSYFLIRAHRIFYQETVFKSVLKCALFVLLFFVVVNVYRLLLFFATISVV